MKKVKYRVENEPVGIPGVIDAKESNEIMFVNRGTAVAEIDGFVLNPGDFLSHSGNEGEINISRYRITFVTAGTQLVFVQRKFYVEN
jgi:hypothetical protein